MTRPLPDRLVERFLRYLAVASQSDARATVVPSTPGQWEMARLLATELDALGLSDVHLDEHAVLTARLPGTVASAPRIGFCAHMDTVDVGLSPNVRPRLLRYDGADLCLNPERDIWLRLAEHPEIGPYAGQDVIVSDGTGVLGADNKAAVAVVMTLLDTLRREQPPHGDVVVAFVPDEEIGLRGAKNLDLARFPVDFAYTIDGCGTGEFVYETFNAAQAAIRIEGVSAHPMSAKGVLVNPVLVAADMTANAAAAELSILIRDFDDARFAERKREVAEAVDATRAAHPRATVSCRITDTYANIASSLGNDRRSLELMEAAFAAEGIEPRVIAMRGGTDGSALSARGIPTPNYFTGAHNFHSPFEFLPVQAFEASYRVTERIVLLAAQG